MIQTQTFDFKDVKDELAVISTVVNLISKCMYQEAIEVLLCRQDQLTAEPQLKLYGT